MEKLNVSFIIENAREKLEGKDSRAMAVFHTGITVAAALVITILQYVLSEGIGNTSGLSGLGTRSVLETIQTVLRWANMLLVPFWGLGFVYAALQWGRGSYAVRQDLLTGFRRWSPYLGLLLNRSVLSLNESTLLFYLIMHKERSFMFLKQEASFCFLCAFINKNLKSLSCKISGCLYLNAGCVAGIVL